MAQDELFKTPPHSTEAEQSVLGGLMIAGDNVEDVSVILNTDDFYTQQHQAIFQAIITLAQNNKPVDGVTVINALESSGELELAGNKNYLVEVVKNTPTAANILYYAKLVRDKSILRSLITSANDISKMSYHTDGKDVREILDMAETKILAIAEHNQNNQRDYKTMEELLATSIQKIDELFNSDSRITGLETHLTQFDELTSGLHDGELIIVAGRPSMGKTTFSMNIAENVAIQNGTSVAVFSMEMPGDSLVMRMISSLGKIDAQRMRTGVFKQEDWPKLNSAITKLSMADIYIDDSPALMINELRTKARRIDKDVRKKQLKAAIEKGIENPESEVKGLGLIVIDYLQLMRGSSNTDNRVNEISEISRGLKALAKELHIPVIALSQLNRALEQRPDKRPKMSDLRESGAIEQDADLIVFIYRDEVYNEDTERKGVAEIILGKQRNGPLGTAILTFIGEYTRFENHASTSMMDDEGY